MVGSTLISYPAYQKAVAIFVTGPVANTSKGALIPVIDSDLLWDTNTRLGAD